jgi:GAF domain-containing protein
MTQAAEEERMRRQSLTAATFVEIVDSLVEDFDVIELLTLLARRAVELSEASQAGFLLADESGHLRVMAVSNEHVELLELFQIQNDEGPCLDCFRTGEVVVSTDLRSDTMWQAFGAESVRAGFASVCAVPLRLRDVIIGCLNLFIVEPIGLSDDEVAVARALADAASIAIVQNQLTRQAALRESQLRHAFTSRIAVEQAKGMIAETAQVDMNAAFTRLRLYASDTHQGLTEVAASMVAGRLNIDEVARDRSATA